MAIWIVPVCCEKLFLSLFQVIFSQSSHDIAGEPPSSVYSSSGELTIGNERASTPSLECNKTDVTSDTYAPVFKEFDFLEGEQDSMVRD